MSRLFRYCLASLTLLLLAGVGFLSYYLPTLRPRLKQRVISAMQERFDADVQLDNIQFSLFPEPQVDGDGLVIQHKQWGNERNPLIKIRHFHAQTDFTTILDWRNRVNQVVLDGLELHIPPRGPSTGQGDQPGHDTTRLKFLIQTIIANHGLVEIETKDPRKEPLLFPIENLTMHSVGPGQAMTFTARLTNARPPGAIDTSGHFGPWQRDDPRATPISGVYTFEHANLGVFNGIGGTLSSQGKYGGILQKIKVEGTTDVPDFSLKKGGAAVHLTTRFHAVVDGTNGDTILDPVDAKFGHSEFICSGGITQKPGERGKTIDLQAQTKYGRMEDILTLVVNGKPILNGNVEFQSRILIPPGKQQVADKLNLDGQFHLTQATFTNHQDAQRLKLLSERASGISKKDEENGQGEKGAVASNLSAKFFLKDGVVHLARLSFEVPGAQIRLAGNFNLISSAVDMRGDFQMHATLSETQSGFKALLLKPLDRFFEKDGAGFELPLSITGTRDHPGHRRQRVSPDHYNTLNDSQAAHIMKLILFALAISSVFAAQIPIDQQPFGKTTDGQEVFLYTLKNASGMEVKITNYGGTIQSIKVPDRDHNFADVVLGFENVEGYQQPKNTAYFGAIIGRYANRLAKGEFVLKGVQFHIPTNDGPNSLHGGINGFNKKVWDAKPMQTVDGPAVELRYLSKDGEEGFPGNLSVTVRYTLDKKDGLHIDYTATTDKETVLNLTNHAYFNLSGAGNPSILKNVLTIDADNYTPVDGTLIPTGKVETVSGTPFDFRHATEVGKRIKDSNEQLTLGKGYDHNFVLNHKGDLKALAAKVEDPASGRVLEVYTTEPGLQFYTGNFLDGSVIGSIGGPYIYRSALTMETQHYPDSPNHPNFPTTVLEPGDTFHSTTIFRFKTEQ